LQAAKPGCSFQHAACQSCRHAMSEWTVVRQAWGSLSAAIAKNACTQKRARERTMPWEVAARCNRGVSCCWLSCVCCGCMAAVANASLAAGGAVNICGDCLVAVCPVLYAWVTTSVWQVLFQAICIRQHCTLPASPCSPPATLLLKCVCISLFCMVAGCRGGGEEVASKPTLQRHLVI
jgi:hypothetical protein